MEVKIFGASDEDEEDVLGGSDEKVGGAVMSASGSTVVDLSGMHWSGGSAGNLAKILSDSVVGSAAKVRRIRS